MAKNKSNFPSGLSIGQPNYSSIDLSNIHRTTLDMGKLVPIFTEAVLAGDQFNFDIEHFVRTMPTIVPIMDNVDIKFNAFYVPYRVLWEHYPDWLTGNDTYKLLGTPKPTLPKFRLALDNDQTDSQKYPNGRLCDYLGVPSQKYSRDQVVPDFSLFPVLAYNKIFLDWYAPQRWVELANDGNFQELFWLKADLNTIKKNPSVQPDEYHPNFQGGLRKKLFELKTVNTNPDYFTNALPTPNLYQEVQIPFWNKEGDEFIIYGDQIDQVEQGMATFGPDHQVQGGIANKLKLATISQLRENVALQHFLEAMQVGGGRYMETMKVIWGQDIPDGTLQRSEYIGGDVHPIFFNEVESNATTQEGNLGDVGGKPVSAGKSQHHSFKAEEHGIFMVLAHVVPKRSYTNAVDKKLWIINEPTDIPNKHFEGIGDQPIYKYELNGEFYYQDEEMPIFGYVPRYFEWKGSQDKYTGEMRHSLMHWHLGAPSSYYKDYDGINPDFLKVNPRNDIFNVVNEPDKIFGAFQLNCTVKRGLSFNPMPGVAYI